MIINGWEVRGWQETKECRHCKQVLPASAFGLRRSSTENYMIMYGQCKWCRRTIRSENVARLETPATKVCKTCKEDKPKNQFSRQLTHSGGLHNKCHDCRAFDRLVISYGVSRDEYLRMLEEQGGVCAICLRPEVAPSPTSNKTKRLGVDHCHTTGAVRRLLCSSCNIGLGSFRDDPDLLRTAAQYLETNRTRPPGAKEENNELHGAASS